MFTRAQLFDLAQRFVGTDEVAGTVDNPQIMAMLKLDARWPHYRNGLGSHDMGDLAANVRQAPPGRCRDAWGQDGDAALA